MRDLGCMRGFVASNLRNRIHSYGNKTKMGTLQGRWWYVYRDDTSRVSLS